MTVAFRASYMDEWVREGTAAMLSVPYEGLVGGEYVAEPKYDGARMIAGVDAEGRVRVFVRSGAEHIGKLPAVEADLHFLPAGTWLDGELVAISVVDGKVVVDWGKAQSVIGSSAPRAADANRLTFMVFDVLEWDGMDTRSLPFGKRREHLEAVFETYAMTSTVLTPQVLLGVDDELPGDALERVHRAFVSLGYEGTMVKDLRSPYRSGERSRAWQKVKVTETVDVFVIDFQEGKSSFAGMVGAVVFGQHDGGKIVERGKCGSGFDIETRQAMWAHPEQFYGRVFELQHMGRLRGSEKLRHPVFVRWRDDKTAKECDVHDR